MKEESKKKKPHSPPRYSSPNESRVTYKKEKKYQKKKNKASLTSSPSEGRMNLNPGEVWIQTYKKEKNLSKKKEQERKRKQRKVLPPRYSSSGEGGVNLSTLIKKITGWTSIAYNRLTYWRNLKKEKNGTLVMFPTHKETHKPHNLPFLYTLWRQESSVATRKSF